MIRQLWHRVLCLLGFHYWSWYRKPPHTPFPGQLRSCCHCHREELWVVDHGHWQKAKIDYTGPGLWDVYNAWFDDEKPLHRCDGLYSAFRSAYQYAVRRMQEAREAEEKIT